MKFRPIELSGISLYIKDNNMAKIKVAIQGIKGCFHESAAHQFFKNEDIEIIPCTTFEEEFRTTEANTDMMAVVAIENTIAGSLLSNYELVRQSGLRIVGEHKLRIHQSICAMPGQYIDNLHEVISHPIALMQCKEYIDSHKNLRAVEFDDTASAAKNIAEKQLQGVAAICSSDAAKLYGLDVIEEGIETNKHNFTRFLILSHHGNSEWICKDKNKSSIAFSVAHKAGSLSKVLTILSFYDINLTKIQSMPLIGKEWEYLFYVDVTFDDIERYRQALEAIRPLTSGLRILGDYKEGEQTI